MAEFNYLIITDTNRVIAQFADFKDATIFLTGVFDEYFAEPDLQYTIKRVPVTAASTSVETIYDRIKGEDHDRLLD